MENSTDALTGETWILEAVGTYTMPNDSLFPTRLPELRFDAVKGMVEGNSGCNGFMAPYKGAKGSLPLGTPGPSTMMYCGPGEDLFRDAIQRIEAFRIDGAGRLELLAQGAPLLRFRPK